MEWSENVTNYGFMYVRERDREFVYVRETDREFMYVRERVIKSLCM